MCKKKIDYLSNGEPHCAKVALSPWEWPVDKDILNINVHHAHKPGHKVESVSPLIYIRVESVILAKE